MSFDVLFPYRLLRLSIAGTRIEEKPHRFKHILDASEERICPHHLL
jgi:hypothetical protein